MTALNLDSSAHMMSHRRDLWLLKQGHGADEEPTKEHTFRPQVNKLHPAMESAHTYVNDASVHERLFRHASPEVRNASEEKAATAIPIPEEESRHAGYPRVRHAGYPGHDAPARSITKTEFDNSRPFQEMLQRQSHYINRAQEKLSRRTQALTPSFQPSLNANSMELMQHRGSFEERQKKFQDKRLKQETEQSRLEQKRLAEATDGQHFKPKITDKAAHLRARSVAEMSHGDLRKRQEKHRRLAEEHASSIENEMKDMKPKLSKKANRRQSTIQIATAEGRESYAQRMEELRRKREEKTRRLKAEVEAREHKECSFKPHIHRPPQYIKRWADARRRQQAAGEGKSAKDRAWERAEKAPEKPGWR